MGIFSRNPVGDFNTQGQNKCYDCGDYYPSGWGSHGWRCPLSAQKDEDDDAREHGDL